MILGSAVLLVTPVAAQGGSVLIDDPDTLIADRAAVETAANRLVAEGVDVVMVVVENAGTTPADAQMYLDNRLDQLGVANNSKTLRGNQIVFYVAPTPGFDGIYYVSQFKAKLDPVYRTVIAEQMRPRFTQGDFGGGMIAGIDAIRTTLNPPASPLPWVVGGAVAVGVAGAAAVPALRKRRAAGETLASTRTRMEQARGAAGVALADLGREVNDARDKAKFDKVSYRPDDVVRLSQLQAEAESRFAQAQAAFDAAEEAQIAESQPAAEHYDVVASKFAQAQTLATEAAEMMAEVDMLRAELDRKNGADPPAMHGLNT
jgi:hypothetical protein